MSADAKFYAETPDGYLVASVSRERGYFSVTGEIHGSRRSYELGVGNPYLCGRLHDEILSAFSQLAPIVRMHLADVQAGEPMHAASNGWYRLGGADMTRQLESLALHGHGSHDAPTPYVDEDGFGSDVEREGYALGVDFVQFFVDAAARSVLCEPEELSVWWSREDFDVFVDETMRPRWRAMAEEANRMIDGMDDGEDDPADVWDEEEFSVELDAGLSIEARLLPEPGHRDGVGYYYRYEVKVSAPGKNGRRRSYTTTFGASVADYGDGRVNAREAAFGTARELLTFEYETARSFIEETCGKSWDDLPVEQRRALERASRRSTACQKRSSRTARRWEAEMTAERREWWTIVTCSGAYYETPARGPWRTRAEANEAMGGFRRRLRDRADTTIAATNARVVGPFRTREAARETDISCYPQDIERS